MSAEAPKRLRAVDEIERLHELIAQSLTRAPRVALPDIEVGQEARTKEWYVKSLSVPMNEGEGWQPWLERVGQIAQMVHEQLPDPAAGLEAKLTESVRVMRDAQGNPLKAAKR